MVGIEEGASAHKDQPMSSPSSPSSQDPLCAQDGEAEKHEPVSNAAPAGEEVTSPDAAPSAPTMSADPAQRATAAPATPVATSYTAEHPALFDRVSPPEKSKASLFCPCRKRGATADVDPRSSGPGDESPLRRSSTDFFFLPPTSVFPVASMNSTSSSSSAASSLDFSACQSNGQRPLARHLLGARICVALLSVATVGIAIVVYSADDVVEEELQVDEAWYRASAGERLPFVCQQQQPADKKCPSYWVRSASSEDLCLQRVDIPLDWSTAHKRCGDMGGALATVHSARQNEELISFCGSSAPCYIGLYVSASESGAPTFQWADGSELDFENWGSEEEETQAEEALSQAEVLGVKVGSKQVTTYDVESREGKVAILMSTVFMACVNMLVMGMACGAFYKAMLVRSQALLLCTTFTDGSCAFCCLFQVVAGLVSLISSDDDATALILEVVITLAQCLLLVNLALASRNLSKSFSQVLPLGCSVDDPQLAGFVADAQALNEASRIVTVVGLPVTIQPLPETIVNGHVAFEV